MGTYYEDLHVSEEASPEVIRAAYKVMAQKWHPDRHPNEKEKAEHHFKIIANAYDFLSNPEVRAEYDSWLKEQRRIQEEQLASTVRQEPPISPRNYKETAEAGAQGGYSHEQDENHPLSTRIQKTLKDFIPGYIRYMARLFAFDKRMTRSEFWPYFSLNFLLICWLPDRFIPSDFLWLFFFICIPPMCQRMNDIGFPKKWLFILLIPGFGVMVAFFWMCLPGLRRPKFNWYDPYIERNRPGIPSGLTPPS